MKRIARLPFPLWLVFAALAAFALKMPWLGFYWDDWKELYVYRFHGVAEFWPFFAFDRPLSAWTYVITSPFLSTNPLAWQLFVLGMRLLTALGFWLAFRWLWPQRKAFANWAALFFLLEPLFTQQYMAVTYSQHWMCYALFSFSLAGMVWAENRSGRLAGAARLGWLGPVAWLAWATAALNLFATEYFVGLEGFRLVVLYLIAARQGGSLRARLGRTLLHGLPYLLLLAAYLAWRAAYSASLGGADPNSLVLLENLLRQPLPSFIRLLTHMLRDLYYILVSSWIAGFNPQTIDLADVSSLFALGVGAGLAGLFGWLLSRPEHDWGDGEDRFYLQPLLAGLLAVVCATLPVWLGDRQIVVGMYSDRFGLAALIGASLALAGLLEWLTPRALVRATLAGLLVGLFAFTHVQNADSYRRNWVLQQRFFWNLAWRAPGIAPGTAILSDGDIFSYSMPASTSFAINLLYGLPVQSRQADYWFFTLGRMFGSDLAGVRGMGVLNDGMRTIQFSAPASNSIAIEYRPGEYNCLHILRPEDQADDMLSPRMRIAAGLADMGRIQPSGSAPSYREELFGREPAGGWCYLYEKAELARQLGRWGEVMALAEQAAAQGYTPERSESSTPSEWRAFSEAYARAGRWEEAADLTRRSLQREPDYFAVMCAFWDTPPMRSPAANALRAELNCPVVQGN